MNRKLKRNLSLNCRNVSLWKLIVWAYLFFWFMAFPAYAGICFLPDCEDQVKVEADNSGAEKCRTMGYESDKSRVCPQYTLIDYCPQNSNYIKCDYEGWCRLNGYVETTCESPYKLNDKCLNGTELYKECLLDDEAACKQENSSYVSTCDAGWALDPNHLCTISNNWGLCCNTCPGYDYNAATLPPDATAVASCDSCWGKRYIIADSGFNQCKGFWDCQDGCEIGSETCVSFGVTKCKTCKRCEARCSNLTCPEHAFCEYENCTQRYCDPTGCEVNHKYFCTSPVTDCNLLGYTKTAVDCYGSRIVTCPYDEQKVYCLPDDGTCCDICKDFPEDEIPNGYMATSTCTCCGKNKYKIAVNPCQGYEVCEFGGADGATSCQSDKTIKYSACKQCPNACAGVTACPPGAICTYDSCSKTYCATGCSSGYKNYCTVAQTDCRALGYTMLDQYCRDKEVLKCPYDSNWVMCVDKDEGDCCRNCKDYPYTSVPKGYKKTGTCTCCSGTFYQAEINDCSGFQSCEFGGAEGATSCQKGNETLYSACKECANACYEVCPEGSNCTVESCSNTYCPASCKSGYQNYCGLTETNCRKLGYGKWDLNCAGKNILKCPYDSSEIKCW